MDNFVAIDVETANGEPTSICSVGAVKVVDGHIDSTFYRLVRPYPNFYFRHFTEKIHGISRSDTDSAPTFDVILPELAQFIGHLPLVAHNAMFDSRCLRRTATYYGMSLPDVPWFCTLRKASSTIPRALVGSYGLSALSNFLGIPLDNHHNALADAEACAKIAMTIL